MKEYIQYTDNLISECEYNDGEKNGKIKDGKGVFLEYKEFIFEDAPRNLEFEGKYLNGALNGRGKGYYDNGKLKYEGEYVNGKKWNVKVKEYNYDGKLIYEGEYLNGEKNRKRKE